MHPFPWNVGLWAVREGKRLLLVLPEPRRSKSTFYPAAFAYPAHAPRSVHFLGPWQVRWDPGHLCDFSPPILCPTPQPQPSTICYFLLYPKNYKQKSFPQGNSNKGQWGHKGQKRNTLVLQALGQQRPWIRQRDGQKNLQGDLGTEAGEPASRACVSLVVACEAAAQRSHCCGGG